MGGYDGVIITDLVMTLPEVSTAHKKTVSACAEGLYDKQGIHPAGTHDPDHPDVGRVLKT
jgi:hypothetical protein